MAGYSSRQSTIATGNTMLASDFNDEYNSILGAMSPTTGHKHDGSGGEGARITESALQGGTQHTIPIWDGASTDIASTGLFTNGQLLVGVTGGAPAVVTMSGDATLATGGALTVTGAAGAFTVAGAFTSIGINDDATTEALKLVDANVTLGVAASTFALQRNVDDQNIFVSGGNAASVGGNLLAYGSTHASAPGRIQLRQDAIDRLRVGDTGGDADLTLYDKAGVAILTLAGVTGLLTAAKAFTVTGAMIASSTLNVQGGFTSLGIDDNSSQEQINIADGATSMQNGATLRLSAGTAALPGLTFGATDTDTGLFWPGGNVVAIATSGVERVRFSSYGIRIKPDGSAATPSYSFDGDTDTGFYLTGTSIGVTHGGVARSFFSTSGFRVVIGNTVTVPNGINGSYNKNGVGTGTNWAGAIYGMGDSNAGSGVDATFSPAAMYGLAWVRTGHSEEHANIGEGVYTYQNGVLQAGMGTLGIWTNGTIKSDGIITSANDIRAESGELYSGVAGGSGDTYVFFRDNNSSTWRNLFWDDSANWFSVEMSDGASYPMSGHSSASANSSLDFPIGAVIGVDGDSTNYARNAVIIPRLDAGDGGVYTTAGASSVLPGTWRVCGQTTSTNNEYYLVRKVLM